MTVNLAQFPIPEMKDHVSTFTGGLLDGFVALAAGDASNANDYFDEYLSKNPRSDHGLLLKGIAQLRIGNIESAASNISKAIEIKPDYANAYYCLGLLQQANSNHLQAAIYLSDAELFGHFEAQTAFIESLKQLSEEQAKSILNQRAHAFSQKNNISGALRSVLILLELQSSDVTDWNTFCEVLRYATFNQQVVGALHQHLITGLKRDDINHYGMVFATISALLFEPGFSGIGTTTPNGKTTRDKIHQQLQDGSLDQIVGNELFNALIHRTLIPNKHFEFWLTAFRSVITELCAEDKILKITNELYERFICNFSHQCFRTEYVYYQSSEDKANLEKLKNSVRDALAEGGAVSMAQVAILALYQPLNDYDFADELLEFEWLDYFQEVLSIQVHDLREERELRSEIKQLTSIGAEVSKMVREQYEENPFPRWGSPPAKGTRKSLKQLVTGRFPHVAPDTLADSTHPQVLVAGCGTGWIPMELSNSIENPTITAVDLSLSSLSYGARKARQQGVTNIQFGQADILKLGELRQEFDHINCYGVLHHMENIIDGFRVLTDILKPGGTMHLGLYSKIARKINWMGREMITEKGYQGSAEDMREFRQDIYRMPEDSLFGRAPLNWGFYMISDVRDMFFHVQELLITLPELKTLIAEVGLEFIGFEIQQPHVPQQFAERFPADINGLSLDNWHEFEQEFPGTFSETYNFWLKKPL